MKTVMQKLKLIAPMLLLFGLSACGKIPKAYRGTFIDEPTGTRIVLTGDKGTLTEAGGRILESKAENLQFDALAQNKSGIYVRNTADDEKEIEVFWLVPDAASRKEEQGFIWMTAEVIYTRMRTDLKDEVQGFQLIHCKDGMILLDLPSKTWNGGCPSNATELNLKRVKQ